MKALLLALVTALCVTPGLRAQGGSASAAGPCTAHPGATFDVATVKPSSTPPGHNSLNGAIDGLKATMTLDRLIEHAYDLRTFQLTGGPPWISSDVWDIQAKFDAPELSPTGLDPAARKAWIERQRQRLQSLLADRFQLKCHFAEKQLPIYELQVAKVSSKLQPTTAPEGRQHSIGIGDNGRRVDFKGTGITMEELAAALSGQLERMVVDKTGLTGAYDLHTMWARDAAPAADSDAPSLPTIFTALEEQFGLKLVPAKGPVQVLVIDSVEKPSAD